MREGVVQRDGVGSFQGGERPTVGLWSQESFAPLKHSALQIQTHHLSHSKSKTRVTVMGEVPVLHCHSPCMKEEISFPVCDSDGNHGYIRDKYHLRVVLNHVSYIWEPKAEGMGGYFVQHSCSCSGVSQHPSKGAMLRCFPVAHGVLGPASLSWGMWQIEIYRAASWSIVQISLKSSALLVTPGQMSNLPRRAGAAGKRWEAQGGTMWGNTWH